MLSTSFLPKTPSPIPTPASIFSPASSLPFPRPRPRPRLRLPLPLPIRAIDAAQSYDYECLLSRRQQEKQQEDQHPSQDEQKLKIAIVGFGNFGQFLARTFVARGHTVLAHSRSDHSSAASSLGASFFRDPHDLCEQHPDVLLLSTSILSTSSVLLSLPLHRLRRNTLFVDVLSVKEFPRGLLLHSVPPDFDILCTHPMFGPESARHGWRGLPFVYDRVRVGDTPSRASRCDAFLGIFRGEGCKMVEMPCSEHDQHAAASQFVTHTVGRVLARMGLMETPISTKGYERLLQLVDNTSGDSFDLYYGLFMYNKNSTELLNKLEEAFDAVKKELLGKLHDIVRKQLFENESLSVPPSHRKHPATFL